MEGRSIPSRVVNMSNLQTWQSSSGVELDSVRAGADAVLSSSSNNDSRNAFLPGCKGWRSLSICGWVLPVPCRNDASALARESNGQPIVLPCETPERGFHSTFLILMQTGYVPHSTLSARKREWCKPENMS